MAFVDIEVAVISVQMKLPITFSLLITFFFVIAFFSILNLKLCDVWDVIDDDAVVIVNFVVADIRFDGEATDVTLATFLQLTLVCVTEIMITMLFKGIM